MIERRLMALFPRDRWCDVSHMLIFHGRRACKARGVTCGDHPICAELGKCCELRVSAKRATPAAKVSKAKPGKSAKPKTTKRPAKNADR
mgnify:CR=1 FL=1